LEVTDAEKKKENHKASKTQTRDEAKSSEEKVAGKETVTTARCKAG